MGVAVHSHFDGFSEGFKDGLNFMVLILPLAANIQITFCSVAERFKEVKEHFCGHFPYFFTAKFGVPYNPISSSKIY
jgi:hypothetical protein